MKPIQLSGRTIFEFAKIVNSERAKITEELESGAVKSMERYNWLIGRLSVIDEIEGWASEATQTSEAQK